MITCEKCGKKAATHFENPDRLEIMIKCTSCGHVQVLRYENKDSFEWGRLVVFSPSFNKDGDKSVSNNYIWDIPGVG